MFFEESLIFLFGTSYPTAFREKWQELSFGNQFFADIKTSNEFSLAVDLGISRPSTVVSEPIPHILVFDNVVESKLYLVLFQHFEHGLRESAFGFARSSFDEDDHRRFAENAFDLWVPDLLLLLEVQSMSFCLLGQRVEYDSNVICFELF
jgi:hypothetical protein